MNLDILIIALFGGMLVLYSYWFAFIHRRRLDGVKGVAYNRHPAWLGLDRRVVNVFVVFQIFAVIGFLVGVGRWSFDEDSIRSRSVVGIDVSILLILFFMSAMLWAPAVRYKYHKVVVFTLVVTALASTGLLGVAIRNDDLVGVISWLLLCLVTVVVDAVIWNHYYFIQNLKKEGKEE